MPVEPGGRESAATSGTEGAPFAPVPIWEQGRKGRRGGRPASDPAMDAGEAAPTGLGEPIDPAYETQPADVGLGRPERPHRDPPVGGVVLGAAALAAIAALGWFASRAHERGMPELTPGGPTASRLAYAAPAEPSATAPPTSEVNPRAPATPGAEADRRAPPPRRSTTPPKDADVTSRVRPAPSATESGANASATAAPTITPPSPGSPSTDPMTVNPAPSARTAPVEGAPSVGSPPTQPAPAPDPGTTP